MLSEKAVEDNLEKYQNAFVKEKEKKRQYGRERYKKILEDEKRRLFEYLNNSSVM